MAFADLETANVTAALLTRNATPLLSRVLHALSSQDTVRKIAILAVDSGSTDSTVAMLQSAGAHVISIAPESFNFGATRDLAYQHAKSPIVVNLSQDAIPAHERWLENLLAPFADENVAATCGLSLPDPERGPQFPWERNGYFYFTREMRVFAAKHGRGLSFANSAVRRSVWEQLRFDPIPLGEDFQFQIKLQSAGCRVAFPEDAPVLHHHDYGLASLYRRCRDEGAALRMLDCPYSITDCTKDLLSPAKYVQWLRELRHGRIQSPAAALFPVLRPAAVYIGSRFGRNDATSTHSDVKVEST